MRLCWKFYLMVAWCCMSATWLPARTFVSQPIATHTTWTAAHSPYILANDIHVLANATLTIEAGVQVQFSSDVQMTVEGNILALGTSRQPIEFRGFPHKRWQGFYFKRAASDHITASDTLLNVFEHCIFDGFEFSPTYAVRIDGRKVQIAFCRFSDCQTAIQTEKQGIAIIDHTQITQCYRPLHVRITSQAYVTNSQVRKFALILIGGSVHFTNNRVEKSISRGRHTGFVVWMTGGGIANIINNTFQDASQAAFTLFKASRRSTILLKNNTFTRNKIHLSISCEFAKKGKFIVQNNRFYKHHAYTIQLFDDCAKQRDTIRLDSNYFHRLTLDDIQFRTLLLPSDSGDSRYYATQIRIKGLLDRRNLLKIKNP